MKLPERSTITVNRTSNKTALICVDSIYQECPKSMFVSYSEECMQRISVVVADEGYKAKFLAWNQVLENA